MPSDNFFLKQRIQANSRKASATNMSPFSGRSQAERDRKPLSAEEITVMFEGAPYFNVDRRKNGYRPQVIFRGDDIEASKAYGTDYVEMQDASFAAATLGSHRAKQLHDGPPSRNHDVRSQLIVTSDSFLEVPSMLSANGSDVGTVGFEHFLQLSISDNLVFPEEPGKLKNRELLLSAPEEIGLREFDLEQIIGRLNDLSDLYQTLGSEATPAGPLNEAKASEMGEELFGKVLSEELGTTTAGTGSVSMRTQVEALQSVLNANDLWHDFSLVEWRIRVGQLLWQVEDAGVDGSVPSERDILLLQIALAAELFVRLKFVKALPASGSTFPPVVSETDREAIEGGQTKKVDYDLLLAERFLENLTISAKLPEGGKGNRSSFFSAISFVTAREDTTDDMVKPLMYPKHQDEQVSALLSFARILQWPHVEDVKAQLEPKPAPTGTDRPLSSISIYATPMGSPRSFGEPGSRTSYFGGLWKQQQQQQQQPSRPGFSRATTAQSMQLLPAASARNTTDGFDVGGWLSRSWLGGLVMPGEPASHFLISTLLENSLPAIDTLGDSANLYGGFVYKGRSFWSKSCVVGRVLAATEGAAECMGWISVPGGANDQEDGWINANVKDFPYAPAEPRIKDSETVAKDSDPLHGTLSAEVQAGDFTTPTDGPPVMGNEVRSHGLSFMSSGSTFELTESAEGLSAMSTSTAQLTFSSPINNKLSQLHVPLTYDIHFISSYPCHPSPASGRKASRPATSANPTSPTDTMADSARPSESTLSFDKELPAAPAHPLHMDYKYTVVPVATLLSAAPAESRSRALSSPGHRPKLQAMDEDEVVILDCRGTADLELLARAWCAKVGENAIVAKSGRTCLACSVREARALGASVIIRI